MGLFRILTFLLAFFLPLLFNSPFANFKSRSIDAYKNTHLSHLHSVKHGEKSVVLTAGAPSISSITKQLGFGEAPSTAFIWVAASNCCLNTSGLRSSLAFISTILYPMSKNKVSLIFDFDITKGGRDYLDMRLPACFAITCAKVVFPKPGGPHSKANLRFGQPASSNSSSNCVSGFHFENLKLSKICKL